MKKKTITISAIITIIALNISLYSCNWLGENKDNTKVKHIAIKTKTDTVSYALGTVWAVNIKDNVGIKTVTYSFYLGVKDYLFRDTSKMGIYKANHYLDQKVNEMKADSAWPLNNDNLRIKEIALTTKHDTFSYALGFAWCGGAYRMGISEITPALLLGLHNGFNADSAIFPSYSSAENYLKKYTEDVRLTTYADVKKANEDWLKGNATQPGVKTLPSGLQYKVMKTGNGISPTDDDIIECHYMCKLIDGIVFDDAYMDGPTFKFYAGSVIEGWTEAIKLMKEGDEWILYIPQNLAYGSGGIGNLVPPYATVLMDVELVKVTRVVK